MPNTLEPCFRAHSQRRSKKNKTYQMLDSEFTSFVSRCGVKWCVMPSDVNPEHARPLKMGYSLDSISVIYTDFLGYKLFSGGRGYARSYGYTGCIIKFIDYVH